MSMTKAAVLAATTSSISLFAGLYLGHILTKGRVTEAYEAHLEDEIRKAKAFYSERNKTGKFSDPVALAAELVPGTDEEETTIDDNDPVASDPAELFEKHIDPEERVNYSKFSSDYTGPAVDREQYISHHVKPDDGESMADFERRISAAAKQRVNDVIERVGESDELKEEVNEVGESSISNVFDTNSVESLEHELKRSRDESRPFIIVSSEFYENEPEHTQTTITYYEGDGVLTDEAERPLNDLDQVVGGKHNLQFGNGSADPNIVYIRNNAMDMDFEVCLDPGTYAQEVLGVAPVQKRPDEH